MTLLTRVEVTPYNAQVGLSDPTTKDYPEWTTGDEAVVYLPRSVAVATQADIEGKVWVEVWKTALPTDLLSHSLGVFDGIFETTRDEVVVGNVVGNETHLVPIERG